MGTEGVEWRRQAGKLAIMRKVKAAIEPLGIINVARSFTSKSTRDGGDRRRRRRWASTSAADFENASDARRT